MSRRDDDKDCPACNMWDCDCECATCTKARHDRAERQETPFQTQVRAMRSALLHDRKAKVEGVK